MSRWQPIVVLALFSTVVLTACSTQTPPAPAAPAPAATTPAAPAAQPQSAAAPAQSATAAPAAPKAAPTAGGVLKMTKNRPVVSFGYPPQIQGSDADYCTPFFERLLSVGEGGVYKPELATSWETAADGKSITFKLRQGVKFHDGTDFDAKAVKWNLDKLLPPNTVTLTGVSSVEVVDPSTVRLVLPADDNLVLYQIASAFVTYIASPTAIEKNSVDWATTHPVGTGPFKVTNYDRNVGLTYAKNTDYWEKGLPYLDGIQYLTITDPMTAMASFKKGEVNLIYDANTTVASQLRDEGYRLITTSGGYFGIGFDSKDAGSIFSNKKVREAMEYAIDKEGITKGPGQGFYTPTYQAVRSNSADVCASCAPRKYDPAKAKALLAEAGYPTGLKFKAFFQDTTWKDGVTVVQRNLADVGLTMEVNYVNAAAYGTLRAEGKIEKGAASQMLYNVFANDLFTLNSFWRTDSPFFSFVARPSGIDDMLNKARLAKDAASRSTATQQIVKAMYDDVTFVPLWTTPRIVVLDKTVQDPMFFIQGDPSNNYPGRSMWLGK